VSALTVRDGYRQWAPHYEAETAVSFLEDRLVRSLTVPVSGRRLLDAGCGVGRRMRGTGASLAVGVDVTPEMLGEQRCVEPVAAADLRALPFSAATFDLVWCRLVIGHIRELDAAYAEMARVCRARGAVVVTDFHPDAVAAGHRRTFRDADGASHEIEHFVHDIAAHEAAAKRAGLARTMRHDCVVGPMIRPFYAAASRLDAYESQRGLKLVLLLAYEARRRSA
jgi:malonyl-CoA O-methyltransferase